MWRLHEFGYTWISRFFFFFSCRQSLRLHIIHVQLPVLQPYRSFNSSPVWISYQTKLVISLFMFLPRYKLGSYVQCQDLPFIIGAELLHYGNL